MNKRKYAVFTMDVEAFTDADCIRSAGIQVDTDLLDGFDTYIDLLDRYDIKSTLFTVGELAPKITDRLHRCISRGHRLALHNYEHVAPMSVPVEEFRQRTREAKERLSRLFDTEVQGFRAPCFSIDKARLDILQELGFRYDSSYLGSQVARHPVKLDLKGYEQLRKGVLHKDGFYEYELPKKRLLGIPMPISGGGYVRLFRWDVMKTLIKQYLKHSDYYVFYVHPFEMTNRKVPVLRELSAYENFYLSAGIRSYARKVEYIIQLLIYYGFEFVTFEELTNIMNREQQIKTP